MTLAGAGAMQSSPAPAMGCHGAQAGIDDPAKRRASTVSAQPKTVRMALRPGTGVKLLFQCRKVVAEEEHLKND